MEYKSRGEKHDSIHPLMYQACLYVSFDAEEV